MRIIGNVIVLISLVSVMIYGYFFILPGVDFRKKVTQESAFQQSMDDHKSKQPWTEEPNVVMALDPTPEPARLTVYVKSKTKLPHLRMNVQCYGFPNLDEAGHWNCSGFQSVEIFGRGDTKMVLTFNEQQDITHIELKGVKDCAYSKRGCDKR